MIRKVLIANRGEIATRIARACRDYGVQSIAVYADTDANALHTRTADTAYALHGSRPADTYLHIPKLLDIAHRSGADAIHPGYGFLSERAEFARAVIDAGLTWIGPAPHTIEALGDKVAARRIAQQVGAPLVAGTCGPVSNAQQVLDFARQHGLPIAIKAAHGGGGRGLKVAWHMEEIAELYDSAVREATAAFGRGECFVEQFLHQPRHIEAQVLADTHGNVLVLGTRDCSLQRRNQKLVEEAPAPFLSDAQRQHIHRAARDICAAAGYIGAGTVEFLLGANGQISFLEVNTRLQVEHPVTEETTGIDLVIEQLRIADGLPLTHTTTPTPHGHSIEFRINAEDPARGYLPTPGHITRFDIPTGPGVRIDSGVECGSTVPGSFDSLLAKLIITAPTREQALARARRALREFHIEGIASVLPFHRAVVNDPAFTADNPQGTLQVHTRWIETGMQANFTPAPRPADAPDSYDHPNTPRIHTFIELDGRRISLGLPAALLAHPLPPHTTNTPAAAPPAPPHNPTPDHHGTPVTAPLSGHLVKWHKHSGDTVQPGDTIALMEAMKMETSITAPCSGTLHCLAETGHMLTAGQPLAHIRPAA